MDSTYPSPPPSRNSSNIFRNQDGSNTTPRIFGRQRFPHAERRLQKNNVSPSDIAAIGITNQRETTIIWDRETGKAIHRAIVWQDRRTVDSFLLWRLTDGRVHATDATNASRTMLYDIHKGCWSEELLELLNVPASVLPKVMDSADDFGETSKKLFGGAIAISGVAGDQQAAFCG